MEAGAIRLACHYGGALHKDFNRKLVKYIGGQVHYELVSPERYSMLDILDSISGIAKIAQAKIVLNYKLPEVDLFVAIGKLKTDADLMHMFDLYSSTQNWRKCKEIPIYVSSSVTGGLKTQTKKVNHTKLAESSGMQSPVSPKLRKRQFGAVKKICMRKTNIDTRLPRVGELNAKFDGSVIFDHGVKDCGTQALDEDLDELIRSKQHTVVDQEGAIDEEFYVDELFASNQEIHVGVVESMNEEVEELTGSNIEEAVDVAEDLNNTHGSQVEPTHDEVLEEFVEEPLYEGENDSSFESDASCGDEQRGQRELKRSLKFREDNLSDPTLSIGLQFPTIHLLRRALVEYAIRNHFDLVYVKSEWKKMIAKCRVKDCTWRVYAMSEITI